MPDHTGPGLRPSPPPTTRRTAAALAAFVTALLVVLGAAAVPSPASGSATGCPASGDQAVRCTDVLGERVGGQPDRTTPSSTTTTEDDEPDRTRLRERLGKIGPRDAAVPEVNKDLP